MKNSENRFQFHINRKYQFEIVHQGSIRPLLPWGRPLETKHTNFFAPLNADSEEAARSAVKSDSHDNQLHFSEKPRAQFLLSGLRTKADFYL